MNSINLSRFPGQYYDQETGLHYNYYRYYDPTTGRYVTPDPIGLVGGINLFVYVRNDPTNNIDPLGLANDPLGLAELREILVLMLPDYLSVNINAGSILGWSGQVALDRYGNLYVGLFGGTIGKSATVVSFSGTAGWLIDCGKRPSEDRLKDFLTKSSINYGFGYLGGLNVTKTPGVGKATEIGYFTPQVGSSYHYSWFWKNTGWKW